MMSISNYLVVAAHPDDEVLGCGGTIARLANEGHIVFCLILGEGITSRYDQPDKADKSALAQLKEQAIQAARILKIKEIYFGSFPDNRFDTIPLLDIVKFIENTKKKIMPDAVYTHHQGDLNIDHQITFKAVLTACRPVKGETVKEIYSFEIPSSTEWNSPDKENYFMPDVFMDISKTLDKKLEALKAYKGEAREYPHPRSPKALRAIAMKWGSTVGMEAVEAFKLIRSTR
jgi:LmbE family N-acetylglucosaminyl deacetylase